MVFFALLSLVLTARQVSSSTMLPGSRTAMCSDTISARLDERFVGQAGVHFEREIAGG